MAVQSKNTHNLRKSTAHLPSLTLTQIESVQVEVPNSVVSSPVEELSTEVQDPAKTLDYCDPKITHVVPDTPPREKPTLVKTSKDQTKKSPTITKKKTVVVGIKKANTLSASASTNKAISPSMANV